ncbi:MAG: hypothetical protein CMJ45_09820, partial [Planctomyces sp.]|nr:hypothetical protein [Planctomyces sp.]
VRLTSFGVFVELLPGRDGLVRSGDLGDIESEAAVGQEITVMIQEIDSQGRINLSRRALFGDDGNPVTPPPRQPAPAGGFNRGPQRPGGFGGGGGRGPQDRNRGPGGPGGPGGPRGPGGPNRGPRPGGGPGR